MRKIVYLILVLFVLFSCTHRVQTKKNTQTDSVVVVYGFAKLPIDSGVEMPYKKFIAYKDSFMPIYDTETKRIVFMRSKNNCKYGDWYVDASGDTLFCVEDGLAKYVSAEEWHKYYEEYKE